MTASDPEQLRSDLRESWERNASFWDTGGGYFYSAAQPVTDWIVDKLAPKPGDRVLELACGRGDLSLELAKRVAPDGHVICSDGAEAMVEVARRRAVEAGLSEPKPEAERPLDRDASGNGHDPQAERDKIENHRATLLLDHRPMELEWVDEPAASLDAIACRFGYMLCVDPEAALREARRVLKPMTGRLAIAVWDLPEHNLSMTAPSFEAINAGYIDRPGPGTPGPFALSAPGRLREVLEDSGFALPEIEPVAISMTAPSLDALWDGMVELSGTIRALLVRLTPAEHYKLRDAVESLWAGFLQPDGTVVVPGQALCAFVEA